MKEELSRCKRLVKLMLNAMEDNLKAIDEITKEAGHIVDTTKLQNGIVDVYQAIEENNTKD